MTMQAPNHTMPLPFNSFPSTIPNFIQDPSLKGIAFNQLLQNRGIRFMHYRAVPCPNMRALDDNTHNPSCSICGTKGFLYYSQREIVGVFSSNSLEKMYEQQGTWEIGSAIVTFPTEYADGTQADFNAYDRLIIPDFEVRLWQLREYEPTSNRQQSLRYPIVETDYVSAVVNNVLIEYRKDVDYKITDNNLEWLVSGNKPPYNSTTGRGGVFAVSYYANPVYTIIQNLRELRVTQEMVNGQKIARRLPQEVMVRKDFLVNSPDKI
jgi:hypothetical protein